jgi:hypothetical protein
MELGSGGLIMAMNGNSHRDWAYIWVDTLEYSPTSIQRILKDLILSMLA